MQQKFNCAWILIVYQLVLSLLIAFVYFLKDRGSLNLILNMGTHKSLLNQQKQIRSFRRRYKNNGPICESKYSLHHLNIKQPLRNLHSFLIFQIEDQEINNLSYR